MVKLTSPNLNYFVVIGTILLSIAMVLFSFPTTNPVAVSVLCWVRIVYQQTVLCVNFYCVYAGQVALYQCWS